MPVKKRTPWLEAFYAALPLCLSYIPVGLACGMLLQKAGFNILLTVLLSMLVFSGGAQFLVVSMISVHASFVSTILMVFSWSCVMHYWAPVCHNFLKRKSDHLLHCFLSQ